jgi:hypothetical protein
MTDVTSKPPIAIRHSGLQRPDLPGLAASFAAIAGVLADAFKIAYAGPYTSHCRPPQVAPNGDLEGRDPNW